MSDGSTSIEKTRRLLVRSAMRRLGSGDGSFALERLHQLMVNVDDLRDLEAAILKLAISGRLSSRELSDGTGTELVEELRAAAGEAKRGGRRGGTGHEITCGVEAIPDHWAWAPLGEIADVFMGQSPPGETYNTAGVGSPLINGPAEFGPGWLDLPTAVQYTSAPTKLCKPGDLLICVRGATTGRTNVAGEEACIGRGVAAIRARSSQRYLDYFVLALRQSILEAGRGSTFPSVSVSDLVIIDVPVPPAKEQERIVNVVDVLLNTTKDLKDMV